MGISAHIKAFGFSKVLDYLERDPDANLPRLMEWVDRFTGEKLPQHYRELFRSARKAASEAGYSFMQVKTVQMGKYEEYDDTNRFYLSLGFQEFEVFPTLWDAWNPCQIYIMTI